MPRYSIQSTSAAAACAVTIPFAAVVWLIGVPAMSLVTFSALAALALGTTYVAFNTWRNSQATRNVAHVINDTEAKARRE